MTFINKKEEVIEVRLTQFGKRQISKEGFRPFYYAFYDDDIIYDSKYVGLTEDQNSIQDRISSNQRLRTVPTVNGIESTYDLNTQKINNKELEVFSRLDTVHRTKEKDEILHCSLENLSTGQQTVPRFNLKMNSGQIKGPTVSYDEGSLIKIPQIETEIEHEVLFDYDSATEYLSYDNLDDETWENLGPEEVNFLDNTRISILNNGEFSFSLEEFNTEYRRDNFEIEFYEIKAGQEFKILDNQMLISMFSILTGKDATSGEVRDVTEQFFLGQEE